LARVVFAKTIQRHVSVPETVVVAATVREALDRVFEQYPIARAHIVDERGGLLRRVAVFIDGYAIVDRNALADPIREAAEIYVLRPLSGETEEGTPS
jgi:sulfur-carrier protein